MRLRAGVLEQVWGTRRRELRLCDVWRPGPRVKMHITRTHHLVTCAGRTVALAGAWSRRAEVLVDTSSAVLSVGPVLGTARGLHSGSSKCDRKRHSNNKTAVTCERV